MRMVDSRIATAEVSFPHMNKRLVIILAIALVAAGIYAYTRLSPQPMPAKNVDMLVNEQALPVSAEAVAYFGNTKGWLSQPKTTGSYPGVIMIHEWWGLNNHMKMMAERLAGEGYIVIAVDLFGSVATTADQARLQIGAMKQEVAIQNLKAAAAYVKQEGATKIASLGWCFGGGQSLQFSLSGEPLDATVIYYGQPVMDEERLKNISWPVLGVFGDKDASISVESVEQFKSALTQAGVANEIYRYPNVGHAFANPSGANYAPDETKDAWDKTLAFLKDALK